MLNDEDNTCLSDTYLRVLINNRWYKMQTHQNVTLSIPKKILRKAKILAIQRNTSLSGLMTQVLSDLVAHQEDFEQALQRNLELLRKGLNMGTSGNIPWQRDELHDRK